MEAMAGGRELAAVGLLGGQGDEWRGGGGGPGGGGRWPELGKKMELGGQRSLGPGWAAERRAAWPARACAQARNGAVEQDGKT